VATSTQHTGRSVAQISLVNEIGQPVLNKYIKQELPVVSYLTALTGITKEVLEANAESFDDATATLRKNLPTNSILVGYNILKDVQWLGLVEGVDFSHLIDLSALFRVWNVQRHEFTGFSQDHCAMVWLGIANRVNHDAVTDATISMYLFNAYRSTQYDTMRLAQLQHMTLTAPRVMSFSARFPEIDGCCMGNRKNCKCGAPFF
jgi:RNA exonuclease 4